MRARGKDRPPAVLASPATGSRLLGRHQRQHHSMQCSRHQQERQRKVTRRKLMPPYSRRLLRLNVDQQHCDRREKHGRISQTDQRTFASASEPDNKAERNGQSVRGYDESDDRPHNFILSAKNYPERVCRGKAKRPTLPLRRSHLPANGRIAPDLRRVQTRRYSGWLRDPMGGDRAIP